MAKEGRFSPIYCNDEELNASDMAEAELWSRRYNEVTQILKRIHATIDLITWTSNQTQVADRFYVEGQSKEKKHYFP